MADSQREVNKAVQEGGQGGQIDVIMGATSRPIPEGAAEDVEDLKNNTDELTSSEQDLKDVLNQIHPAFGGLMDGMRGAMNLANDLSTKNLSLSGIVDKVSGSLKSNAGAYALLGAGGAALIGVSLAISKWQELRKEHAEATASLREYLELKNQMREEREDVRGQLADELVARGKTDQQTLDEAALREQQLRKAGFEDHSVQVAAALAGTGANAGEYMRMAAATERGWIDPSDPRARARLGVLERDPRRAAELEGIAKLRGQELDRTRDTARQQFGEFDFSISRNPFGRDEIAAHGDSNEILGFIEGEYGLSGDQAQQALEIARQLEARRQNEELARKRGQKQYRPAFPGEEAYELPTAEGDHERVDPVVEQIAQALWERMRRDREGPSQEEQNLKVVDQPPAAGQPQQNVTVIHNHQPRNYGSPAGVRGGVNGQNARERSGAE